jgi:hypothetical protein
MHTRARMHARTHALARVRLRGQTGMR